MLLQPVTDSPVFFLRRTLVFTARIAGTSAFSLPVSNCKFREFEIYYRPMADSMPHDAPASVVAGKKRARYFAEEVSLSYPGDLTMRI